MNAPVYPVEHQHDFPKDPPVRDDPKGKDDLKFPVLGVEGKHSFKDKAPAHHEQKNLQRPAYDVEHKHKFTRDETISEPVKTLQAPAYEVGHEHKFPSEGKLDIPESRPPKEMQFPVLDVEHQSKFEPKRPDPSSKAPAELSGPKLKLSDREHSYTGIEMVDDTLDKAKKLTTELVGPVYDTEAVNHFKVC